MAWRAVVGVLVVLVNIHAIEQDTTLAQSSPSPTPSLRVLTPSDAPQVLHGRAQRDAGVEPPPRRARRARLDQCLRKWRRLVRHLRRRLPGNRRVYSKSWPRLRPRRRDRDRARLYSRKTGDLLFEVFVDERRQGRDRRGRGRCCGVRPPWRLRWEFGILSAAVAVARHF